MGFDLSDLQPKERASFALRALYEAAGCRKYHMGRFEEYGLYQENRSFLSSEQVITFTDLDGRLLALKPDVTLSIAKTAQPAPGETLKYYYHENVYRPSAESHTFKEIAQMGLEMLGAVGEAQVQQAVGLAAKSLEQLGAAWVLELSHMGYLFGLLDALAVPETARPALLDLLREKNAHELRAAAKAAGQHNRLRHRASAAARIRNCFFIAHVLLCLPVTRLFYGLIVPPVSLCSNSQNVLFFGTFRRIQEARSVLTIYYTTLCSFTYRNIAFISSKIHLIIVLG